jgi:orotate phosphoribosyltransferase-like protein
MVSPAEHDIQNLIRHQTAKYDNTISAREMADLLGIPLRNTAYYLLKKGEFKTMLVDGRIRVDINSFNEWYAGQSHYKKISDGNGGAENGINCKA